MKSNVENEGDKTLLGRKACREKRRKTGKKKEKKRLKERKLKNDGRKANKKERID